MISIHLFVYFVSCGDIWKIEREGGGRGPIETHGRSREVRGKGRDEERWEIKRDEGEGWE